MKYFILPINKNKSLKKRFFKINYIDNKYSQSLDYIVQEFLKIIEGNRNSTTKFG